MTQSIQELSQRVATTSNVFSYFLNNQEIWTSLSEESKKIIITGINKSFGQALSAMHEYNTSQAGIAKLRKVETQTRGDVTIGSPNDLFAKTIECKSATAPTKGDVNALLRKALPQIAGVTGHYPRPEDARVIDLKIEGTCNPWPASGGTYGTQRTPQALDTLIFEAEKEVKNLLDESSAKPLKDWILADPALGKQTFHLGSLNYPNQFSPTLPFFPHPNSSRPVYIENSQVHKARCLTIKIRFTPTYPLTAQTPNSPIYLEQLTLQAYRNQANTDTNNPTLIVKVVKHITYTSSLLSLLLSGQEFIRNREMIGI